MEQQFPYIIWGLSICFLILALILMILAILLAHHLGYLLSKKKPLHLTEEMSIKRYRRNVLVVGLLLTATLLLTCLINKTFRDFFFTTEVIVARIIIIPTIVTIIFLIGRFFFKKKKVLPIKKASTQ